MTDFSNAGTRENVFDFKLTSAGFETRQACVRWSLTNCVALTYELLTVVECPLVGMTNRPDRQ